ncbi:phosphate ABC transporter substrate-binding protein PstS [Pandoraea sp.]|uniref:phosphate ABC transporter substrate-binding protein PstS n=1 Tax=Pandoraea sp. TaxID=1883445 RepID=UPI001215F7E5|nr:phosphate ABC transporter substrate-binding protein PstS [Pandoraea sp.]TAL52968.1 MAG: phosphate ABC transporter substrate-binding protein PstS [Pandoraea sp.]TAM19432.1 MAG: phosphate ABC transporter substrate-binding protein PstS [Pandoraea sp.]
MKFMKTAVAGLAGIVIAGSAFAADITGAGSTFAAPIYTKWADAYQKATSNKVNYQGIGSSGGIKQIISKTVDFAGSDAPLTDEQLAKDGLFQFPTVIGGILPVVNLKGVKPGEMVLSGPVLADIYLGKVKKWNDPAIQALNPKLNLPDQAIVLVRRADGSGTTFIFSNYLSKVSPTWKSEVGVGTSLKWPATSAGGNGNPGVAAFVQRLPGAIGYVESAYVQQNHMTYTAMKNASGSVVEPKEETFKAAAAGADWSKSFYQILTDEPGKNAWPIVGATFVLLHTKQDKPVQGAEVLKFFDWSFKNGLKMASDLDYIPLPESVINQIRQAWKKSIKDESGKAIYQ